MAFRHWGLSLEPAAAMNAQLRADDSGLAEELRNEAAF